MTQTRIAEIVAAWPPLTPEQRDRVRYLLTTNDPVPRTRSALDEALDGAR